MTGIYLELRGLPRRIGYWFGAQVRRVRRLTAVPLSLRAGAGLSGAAALGLALPLGTGTAPGAIITACLAGTAVAVAPRSTVVSVAGLGTIGVWLFTTTALDEPVSWWRVGLLAAALYLTHSFATLAAVLPTDAVVSRRVVRDWAVRTAGVLATGLAAGLLGMAALSLLPGTVSIIGPLLGSVVAAGLVGLLAWLHVRRRENG